jgi:hypothetical protein
MKVCSVNVGHCIVVHWNNGGGQLCATSAVGSAVGVHCLCLMYAGLASLLVVILNVTLTMLHTRV